MSKDDEERYEWTLEGMSKALTAANQLKWFHGPPKPTERDRILSLIEEHAQRYSRGSVTRVALDNLALEIKERG